jgi:Class II flagellar assembly regulator
LKIGLLSGEVDAGMVARLRSAEFGLKDGSGDPLLDEVLAEIELRVEVELAKMKPDTTPLVCANGRYSINSGVKSERIAP